MTITNTYVPVTTKVTVKKTWDDNGNEAGARPSNATIQLYKTVKGTKTAVGSPVTVGSDKDTWTAEFTNLPVYEKGEEIVYSVEETLPDGCLYEAVIGDEVPAEPEDSGTIEITNTLNAVMSDPPVQKIVKGNPPTDATFTFQMKAVTDGAPMPEGSKDGVKTVQITGNGSYEFGEMWFTEAGEWVYEISEVNDGVKGYTYDTTKYTLTVTVTEDESGKLVKEETVTGGDGEIVFTNVYEEEPLPKTGDNAPTTLVLLALLVSGAALVLLRQRRKEEN
jgi:pilin isopeptide linkage protein/LPXTG-motif cell wall-anchored protein